MPVSTVTATVVTAALLTGACGGAHWPQHAPTVTSSELGTVAPVRTIDLLPTDLEVWAAPGVTEDIDQVRLAAEARLVGVVSETFYRRGYTVGAVVDWGGRYVGPDGNPMAAMSPQQLEGTIDSLAGYGTLVGNTGSLPTPILPARLGASGSDASLYIGGWGFAGKEPDHGKLAGKIILGTVLIVGIVALAIVLSKSKGDPLGKVLGGAGRTAARAGASMGRAALRAGTAVVDIGRATVQTLDALEPLVDPAIEIALAPSSSPPTMPQRPVWSNDKTLPKKGRPKMYLEMTLVDNRTGRVLWHVHQAFPANPARPGDVMRSAKLMLASLPPS